MNSRLQPMQLDDSHQSLSTPGPINNRNNRGIMMGTLRYYFWQTIGIVAWPLTRLYGAAGLIFGLMARLLRIRPGITLFTPRNPFTRDPLTRLSPSAAAERFVQSTENLTHAVRYSRRFDSLPSPSSVASSSAGVSNSIGGRGSSAIASGSGSGNSSGSGLRERVNVENAVRAIPDFIIGSYDDAIQRAKDQVKVLMVVLTCEEHGDDTAFKRNVLTDPDLLNTLNSENILVWGGDIRQRDAYQASQTLSYLALPFVAFIALQPRSPTATTSTSARMTVVSRLEGNPSTTTSADAILTHLTTLVVPRVTPYFIRERAQLVQRRAERALRAEQDLAYERAGARDTERVLKKRAEEEAKRTSRERKEREEGEEREKQERRERLRMQGREWRKWKRQELRKREEEEGEGSIRISVRLGDGRVKVRQFAITSTVEDLYEFVECELDVEEAMTERMGEVARPPTNYTHLFEFQLATTFPRRLLDFDLFRRDKIRDVEGLIVGTNGNLIVEGLAARRISMGESIVGEDDEEEEEEEE